MLEKLFQVNPSYIFQRVLGKKKTFEFTKSVHSDSWGSEVSNAKVSHYNPETLYTYKIKKTSKRYVMPTAEYWAANDFVIKPKSILIDVREPSEILRSGPIPESINVPLSLMHEVLSLDVSKTYKQYMEKSFKKRYHQARPNMKTEITFYCSHGNRSQRAAQYARVMGYRNVKTYV